MVKGDQFPFTFYPYDKIMIKTTDQTKQQTKPCNFGEGAFALNSIFIQEGVITLCDRLYCSLVRLLSYDGEKIDI